MRRGLAAAGMLLFTVLAVVWLTIRQPAGETARVVRVCLGDVRVTAALTGRLGYAEEYAVLTSLPGQVAEVYAVPGQQVTAGQALMRLDGSVLEQAASAFAAFSSEDALAARAQTLLQGAIVRAPRDAYVRQVLAQESQPVAAGEPVVMLSGSVQVVRCTALEKDVRGVQPGMPAVLLADGEEIALARVAEISAVTAEPATGRMVCEVTLMPEEPLDMPAGTALDADVILQELTGVPVLPVEAMTSRDTLWWVHDGICTEIPAEIVLSDEMLAAVMLQEGTAVAFGEFTDGQRIWEDAP